VKGLFRDNADIAARWSLDRRFEPSLAASSRDVLYEGWNAAVARVRAA
jgi:glycerol kinase